MACLVCILGRERLIMDNILSINARSYRVRAYDETYFKSEKSLVVVLS